jgi:hypothetical protein
VRIGVVGHRFPLDIDRVRKGVNTALDYFQQQFPAKRYLVLASLAEGADRLVAKEAIDRKMALVVPLPLSESEYLKDFPTKESRQQFKELLSHAEEIVRMPPQQTREQSYEAAGEYVISHCNVLLAIWDGREPQGEGGTGWVVERARRLAIPLAWVHAGNRASGTNLPTTLGDMQGSVSFEPDLRLRGK